MKYVFLLVCSAAALAASIHLTRGADAASEPARRGSPHRVAGGPGLPDRQGQFKQGGAPIETFQAFQAAFQAEFGHEWASFRTQLSSLEDVETPRELVSELDGIEKSGGVAELLALRGVEPGAQLEGEARSKVRAWVGGAIETVEALRGVRSGLERLDEAALGRIRGLQNVVTAVDRHAGRVAFVGPASFYDRMLVELRGQMQGFQGLQGFDPSALEATRQRAQAGLEGWAKATEELGHQIVPLLTDAFGLPPEAAEKIEDLVERLIPFVRDELVPRLEAWMNECWDKVVRFLDDVLAQILDFFKNLLKRGDGGGEDGAGGPGGSGTGEGQHRSIEGILFDATLPEGATVLGNIGAGALGPYQIMPLAQEDSIVFVVQGPTGKHQRLVIEEGGAGALTQQLTRGDRTVHISGLEVDGSRTTMHLQGLASADDKPVRLQFAGEQLEAVLGLMATDAD